MNFENNQKRAGTGHDSGRRLLLTSAGALALTAGMPTTLFAAENKVRAAIGLDSYYATYIVARELGMWSKAGLDFSYHQFDDGSLGYDAIATGNADIASATMYSQMQRVDKGIKLYAVAAAASSGELFSIMARPDIKKPTDLIGKSVAFPKGTIAHYLFNQYALKRSLPLDKIEQKNVPAPESIAALLRGDVDAFLLWEPWPTRAVTLVPGAHKLANLADDNIRVYNWLCVGPALIKDEAKLLSILRVMRDASQYIKANRKETISIVSKVLKFSPEDAAYQVNNIDYSMDFSKAKVTHDYESLGEFALQVGRVKKVPALADIARPEFIKQIDPSLAAGW